MPIDYSTLKNWRIADQHTHYTSRDSILYALSLGYGADPLDSAELPFVYEQGQKAVPSLLTVLGAPGAWITDPGTGVDWMKVVHGEHRMTLHGDIKPEGALDSKAFVSKLIDKGAGRGALVVTERRIHDHSDGTLLATVEHTSFCRADGGFGQSDAASEPLPGTPSTEPDRVVQLASLPGAALLYRLNGDRNPLHADPAAARAVGFEKPLLHGLCTYGMACRAILKAFCESQPHRLRRIALRFSAPFFPGETLRVELWRSGANVQFRALSAERNTAVLTHGVAIVEG